MQLEWTTIMSILVFVALLTAEAILSHRRKLKLFAWEDTVTNLVLGLLTFVTKVGTKTAITLVYASIFALVPYELPAYSWVWALVGLLLNDLMFYWYHRLSHTTRFFWALHVAHHSSNKMNITTAIRGNFVNNLFHAIFWIPMLLLGFPPAIVILCDAFSYFYQLWLHTQIIPKLGPLEFVLNTPSHHRVHHGSNPQYIDKNYGAIFIFWDRIFGTFEEEKEPVRYGLTKPLETNNPMVVAFYEFGAVFRAVARRKGLLAKAYELFRRPYDPTLPMADEAASEPAQVQTIAGQGQ
jgi:sterol desaturase/sphingolipid hydroxylase (fatty acid hydroxylase superfamily)